MEVPSKNTVLITGFGPFSNHIVNASWEAVKELNKLCATSKELKNVEVIVKEMSVSYEDVDTYVPKLWEEYKPTLVLHVGVSSKAKSLTIECCAHSNGYLRQDTSDKCPDESNIKPKILETKINVNKICSAINENSECNACISHDAGRYLCEYIFYKSLQIDPMKTLFIHVPDFDQYSSIQTAKGLHDILCYLIKDMKNMKD
ncbi:pyroglutamyl-peptidase 1 [Osmia lignaria lignaria]|uniref:pyroglutamyl-peptidase 1 n=1 Tax=Osmia lignaria lignaria TaxID=1437193 RepID=UPI0014796CB1|nr:pyroglutamyl-peptidase 1 [Osmia lignaria]